MALLLALPWWASTTIMPMETSLRTAQRKGKSPRDAVLDMTCRHVADFTTQKMRASWIAMLQAECGKKPTTSVESRCLHVGHAGIKKVDAKVASIIMQNCLEAPNHVPEELLSKMAMSRIAGVHTESVRMKASLNPMYEEVINDAKSEFVPLARTDEYSAKKSAIDLWCHHLAQVDVESNLRFIVVTEFLRTCNRLRKSSVGENTCMQVGAKNISDIVREFQEGHVAACVRFVSRVPAASLAKVSAIVESFHVRNETSTDAKAVTVRTPVVGDRSMGHIKELLQGAIENAHIVGMAALERGGGPYAGGGGAEPTPEARSGVSTAVICGCGFTALVCALALVARKVRRRPRSRDRNPEKATLILNTEAPPDEADYDQE